MNTILVMCIIKHKSVLTQYKNIDKIQLCDSHTINLLKWQGE